MADNITEKILKKQIVHRLAIGAIQLFQIRQYLKGAGIPEFRIDDLEKEIKEEYLKNHPCF